MDKENPEIVDNDEDVSNPRHSSNCSPYYVCYPWCSPNAQCKPYYCSPNCFPKCVPGQPTLY